MFSGMVISLPAPVAECVAALGQAGHSAHIVGGCVRDSLMGRLPSDWDVCTSALPEEAQAVFAVHKVIPTGIRHGTITLLMGEMPIEITTLRRDGDYLDHRRPQSVSFTDSLAEDLARRDFTVNAMAYHPKEGLIDPFGGAADLRAGVLRCVGDPRLRFDEDALRILRLFRFVSQLGLEPEPDTLAAAGALAPLLEAVSAERISAELSKLLLGENVYRALCLAADSGALGVFLPEITPCIGLDQSKPAHIYPVDRHCFLAAASAPPRLELRLAMLFHDIGKPDVYRLDEEGVGRFPSHAVVSAAHTRAIMTRLRYPARLTEYVALLVGEHCVKLHPDKAYLRRLCGRLGFDAVRDLSDVKRADDLAKAPAKVDRAGRYDAVNALLEEIAANADPLTQGELAVGGNDLLAMGVPYGPRIGELLQFLLELVLDAPELNTRDALLLQARRYLQQQSGPDA